MEHAQTQRQRPVPPGSAPDPAPDPGAPDADADGDVICPTFAPGERVTIQGNPSGITLRSHGGRIVRADPAWAGYYLVALDEPADDWESETPVTEIVEAAFNLVRAG